MKLSFSKKIYGAKAVRDAVKAFSEYADLELEEKPGSVEVTVSGVAADEADEFRGEFCNYALCMTRNAG